MRLLPLTLASLLALSSPFITAAEKPSKATAQTELDLYVTAKEAFRGIIDRVPASRMSEISKEFAYRIILANREELLAQSEVIIEISKE